MNKPLQTVEAASIANQALVTLDPETYAAAVYEPFKARLETAIANSTGIEYNIQTKEGMAVAKEHRAVLRAIRIDADKERAARKAPITAIGKLLESKYTELESAVTPHEDKFHADIKAEEERIETEKAAKLKAEEDAKAAIQNKIDAIKNKPLEVMNKSVADIEEAIAELSPLIPTPAEFGERFIEAEYALKATLDTLASIVSGKKAQEQLEAQNRALQAEQEAREAEAQLAAKEQARVDGIKANIQNIKNFIIEGSECETSAQLDKLIVNLQAMEITEVIFAEFLEDALSAASKTLQVLDRQHAAMVNAELAELEARKAKEAAEIKARQELEAQIIAEAKNDDGAVVDATFNESDFNKVFADAIKTGTGVMSVSVNEQSEVKANHIPAVQVGSVRPTAQSIINLVAKTYNVDTATANRWLAQSFGELKAA